MCIRDRCSDETLCQLVAGGSREAEEALVTRYNRLVRTCARPFFLVGGDSEDLTQEGMVGLLKAVREYDASKEASFRTFAEICIRNRLYSVLRAAARDKHMALNQSVPLDTDVYKRQVCALDMKRRGKLNGNALVATVMSNLGLHEFCRNNGIDLLLSLIHI